MDDHVPRPDPAAPSGPRIREWIGWFGVWRLVTSAVAVVAVCAGAWWLLRAPTPPPESVLPRAAVSVPGPSSTAPAPTSTLAAPPAVVWVHVTGAVRLPGVYEFTPGDRIGDAVATAGGATAAGRPHELNLAAPLTDGMRVVVPIDGETVPAELRRTASVDAAAPPRAPVDVNTAPPSLLDELPGVGPATATAIVEERDLHGPFVSVDDLLRVPGIGPATLDQLRDSVTT